jgi:hypothetical protein
MIDAARLRSTGGGMRALCVPGVAVAFTDRVKTLCTGEGTLLLRLPSHETVPLTPLRDAVFSVVDEIEGQTRIELAI